MKNILQSIHITINPHIIKKIGLAPTDDKIKIYQYPKANRFSSNG